MSAPQTAAGWLEVAREWKGDLALLKQFCKARPYVRSGRFAERIEDVGPIRFAPRLARKNITLDGRFSYDTREEALRVAVEYRAQCRTLLSAMSLNEEIEAWRAKTLKAEHPAPATASVATPSIDAADIKGQNK